ncbi:cytochrome P450 6BT1 [Tribolium castaneum]|uniref:Cytochrome P450 6BT1 n=2 Tax=Tribolium castaneum TaxID=7070 RepID=D2A5K1_TRICA|nr:PREDICTED: probable cytochrome P450 6a20 [Tribolium castaneum]EFA05733.1 cytochrome P450 6BT1 [Tribolium castaneum]|eukprot:XP_969982.1 PREDICTED: probable cytochrome P450 6a20 [Tribolium castaneum]
MLLLAESLITLVLLLIAYYKFSFQYWKRQNVPFIQPSIPWGNYPSALKRQDNFGELVVRMYHQMKKQGHKYFGIYLFFQPCFVPTDPKFIKLILAKDFQHFNFRNFYYNEKDDPISAHLLSLNGEKWKRLRSKLTPTFTAGKIKMVFKIFVECGKIIEHTLEHHAQNRTSFDVKEMFSSYSTDVIVNCAFGVEVDRLKKTEFKNYSQKALDFNTRRCIVMYLGAVFPKLCRKLGFRQIAKSAGDFFINIVRNTVEFREKTNTIRNDFLQLLINLKNDESDDWGQFSIEEVAAQCFIFFLAGFETSATTMSFALYEIAANPHVYEQIMDEMRRVLDKYNGEMCHDAIKEMTYLGQVVDETLRIHSPAYAVSRTCTQDYHVPETNIVLKKGFQVLIPIRGIHSDPEFYPEPEKFKPERFHPDNRQNIEPYSYLPFGEGPRICIG